MKPAREAEPLLERLRDAGVLTRAEAEASSLRVSDRERYTLAVVDVAGTPRWVVKAARVADVAPLLAHERGVLRHIAQRVGDGVAPPVADTPAGDDFLVLAHVAEADAALLADPAALGLALAARLARLHASCGGEVVSVVPTLLFPRLDEPAARHPATAASWRFLTAQWRTAVLIHGDVKWEHVRRDGVLVDWELAGLGDPAWDLAGLLHELCMSDATPRALGQTVTTYAEALGRQLGATFLTRCRAALSVRFVQSAEEYRMGSVDVRIADRAEASARWWAEHPDALDRCLQEAA